MAREVREELSNQGDRGWMIYLQQGQLASTLKVALMAGSTSSNTTERSAQIFLLQFSFSKTSLLLSFLNSSLLKGDTEEMEGVLLALVFLGMVLG